MSVDHNESRQHIALRSLIEISDSKDEGEISWKNNRIRKKHKSLHKPKAIDTQQTISKSQKLPLIPKKNNFEHKPSLKSNSKINHCLILDKGLGVFNSVQIKRGKGQGRYLENSSNYIRLYSESNEQEIELIKNWLNAKKQSCRSYQFISSKKQKTKQQLVNHHISIKHLL